MGAGYSGHSPPPGTVVLTLQGDKQCDQCQKITCPYFPYSPTFSEFISQQEYESLVERVQSKARQYANEAYAYAWLGLFIPIQFILPQIVKIAAIGMFGSLLGVVACLATLSHVTRKNQQVDRDMAVICQETTVRLGGSGNVSFVTHNTGMCKPKHARRIRQVWIQPSMLQQQFGPGGMPMMPMQPGMPMPHGQPGMPMPYGQPGMPMPYGQPVPQQPVMGQPVPMQMGAQPAQQPPAYQPSQGPDQPPVPTQSYYPNVSPQGAPPTATPVSPPAAMREIFYVKCPDGVNAGETFTTTAPSGRRVTVTAPSVARPGLEFQVHA